MTLAAVSHCERQQFEQFDWTLANATAGDAGIELLSIPASTCAGDVKLMLLDLFTV